MRKNPTELSEQVFENRNKAYGAYKIRKAYYGIIIGATIFVSIAVLFIFWGSPLLNGDFGQGDKANLIIKSPEIHPALGLIDRDSILIFEGGYQSLKNGIHSEESGHRTIDVGERENPVKIVK